MDLKTLGTAVLLAGAISGGGTFATSKIYGQDAANVDVFKVEVAKDLETINARLERLGQITADLQKSQKANTSRLRDVLCHVTEYEADGCFKPRGWRRRE